jgi:hypothetical protein
MQKSSTSSRNAQQSKEPRKSATVTAATRTSSIPQPAGSNTANERCTLIYLHSLLLLLTWHHKWQESPRQMLIQPHVSLLICIFHSLTHFTIAWVGAAPTGNRKRTVSDVAPTAQPPKKVKRGMNHIS